MTQRTLIGIFSILLLESAIVLFSGRAIADFHSNGANLSYRWVDRLECGPEGRARTAEIREFFAAHPDPSPDKLLRFYRRQTQKWVKGSARPEAELSVGKLSGGQQWMPRTQQINRL
jgi:hypothetical protein